MAVVLAHSHARGTAKLVLLGIANHAGDGGAWPTIATLARYANCSPRSVQRAIASLIAARELWADPRGGGLLATADHLRPNRYQVLLACPAYCDRSMWHRDTRRSAAPQTPLFGFSTPVDKLSTDPLTPVSPPDASVTTPPDASVTLNSNKKHLLTVDSQVQDARARDPRRCATCGQPEDGCLTRQVRLAPEDRHPYAPAGQ